jgi:hypothetical protein
MLIVLVIASLITSGGKADGYPGLLHKPHHLHEHRSPSRHKPHATDRYPTSHTRLHQIPHYWVKTRSRRRTIDDYNDLGMQDMPSTNVQQTHLRFETTIGC